MNLPTQEQVSKLFNTLGYDVVLFEQDDSSIEVLLRSSDGTHTIRKYNAVDALWPAVYSDAWRTS